VLEALLIGSAVITMTIVIAILLFDLANCALRVVDAAMKERYSRIRPIALLLVALLWILLVLTLSIWCWAAVYFAIGLFDRLEPALYFAIVSFTTVGYGDVVLNENWRLLAGMTATNGLLIFGLFTACLVEILDLIRVKNTD
jgi:hypothetical protein